MYLQGVRGQGTDDDRRGRFKEQVATFEQQLERHQRMLFFSLLAAFLVGTAIIFSEPLAAWLLIADVEDAQGRVIRRAKTGWDWLELLIVPALIAFGVAVLAYVQKNREFAAAERAREELKSTQQAASDRARAQREQTSLESYYDRMAELLLRYDLHGRRRPNGDRKPIATAQTLTVLRSLSGGRKGQVLRFLHDSRLIDADDPIVCLAAADLDGADLRYANLEQTNLQRATLTNADLRKATLAGADLRWADLRGAKLAGTRMRTARMVDEVGRAAWADGDITWAMLSSGDQSQRGRVTVLAVQLAGATYDEDTEWPDGVDRAQLDEAGAKLVENEEESMWLVRVGDPEAAGNGAGPATQMVVYRNRTALARLSNEIAERRRERTLEKQVAEAREVIDQYRSLVDDQNALLNEQHDMIVDQHKQIEDLQEQVTALQKEFEEREADDAGGSNIWSVDRDRSFSTAELSGRMKREGWPADLQKELEGREDEPWESLFEVESEEGLSNSLPPPDQTPAVTLLEVRWVRKLQKEITDLQDQVEARQMQLVEAYENMSAESTDRSSYRRRFEYPIEIIRNDQKLIAGLQEQVEDLQTQVEDLEKEARAMIPSEADGFNEVIDNIINKRSLIVDLQRQIAELQVQVEDLQEEPAAFFKDMRQTVIDSGESDRVRIFDEAMEDIGEKQKQIADLRDQVVDSLRRDGLE